jgi:GNAT superfamily N-acetyltransferase
MGESLLLERERAVVDAWPANETDSLEGWVLRVSGGPTHRGNSVATLETLGESSLASRIERAEAWYAARGRLPMFQLGPCAPPELDAALAARGYVREGAALYASASPAHVVARALQSTRPLEAEQLAVDVAARASDVWLGVNSGSSRFASSMDVFRGFLERLSGRCRFVTVFTRSGEPAATALGVISGPRFGVYAMFTRAPLRRSGAARAALRALGQAALENGAHELYLLVEGGNTSARSLYTQCGFSDDYGYHYRAPRI